MDIQAVLSIYSIIAISAGITSYIRLYWPAISLTEEVLEYKTPYKGVLGSLLWIIYSTIIAPWTLFILFATDNQNFITSLASSLIEKHTDE